MYVFGNADLLSHKSEIWGSVIAEFKEQRCYGTALPITCHQHPHDVQLITDPSRLLQVSPDGATPDTISLHTVADAATRWLPQTMRVSFAMWAHMPL